MTFLIVLGRRVLIALVAATFLMGSPSMAQQSTADATAYVENVVLPQMRSIPYIDRMLTDFPEQEVRLRNLLIDYATQYSEQELIEQAYLAMYELGAGVAPYYFARATDADLSGFYHLISDIGTSLESADPMRCKRMFNGEAMPDGTPAMDARARSIAPFADRIELATAQIIGNAQQDMVAVDQAAAEASIGDVWGIVLIDVSQDEIALISGECPVLSESEHQMYCSLMTRFFRTSLTLPVAESGNLYRFFFTLN